MPRFTNLNEHNMNITGLAYIVLTILILDLVSAQAPPEAQLWVLAKDSNHIRKINPVTGSIIASIPASCVPSDMNDATMGSDGNIWWTSGSKLQQFSIESETCGAGVVIQAGNPRSVFQSPGGKYLYYVVGLGDIYRFALNGSQVVEYLWTADGNADTYLGFQDGKLYVATATSTQTINSYTHSLSDDSPIMASVTSASWLPRAGYEDYFWKLKKCPVEPNYFCGVLSISGTGQWISRSNLDGSDFNRLLDTYNPAGYGIGFYDYWTAPWDQMYGTLQYTGIYYFNSSQTGPLLKNELVSTGVYGGLVALMPQPAVTLTKIGNVCQASMTLPSYAWLTTITVEVKNSLTGIYEQKHVANAAPSPTGQNITISVICDASTKGFRVKYDGNTTLSEGIYSKPKTISCTPCLPPPEVVPNVIPILECIEPTQSGFTVHLGYNNTETVNVTLAVGTNNRFSDINNRNQPTLFRIGRSGYYPTSAFTFNVTGGSFQWFLSTYSLTINMQDTARYCPSTATFSLAFTSPTVPSESDIEEIRLAMAAAIGISETRLRVIRWTVTPVAKKRADANMIELENEISAATEQQTNEPTPAQAVTNMINVAQNDTAIQQVIDPSNSNPDRQPLGVETLPSGLEKEGIIVVDPPVTQVTPVIDAPEIPAVSFASKISVGLFVVLIVNMIIFL